MSFDDVWLASENSWLPAWSTDDQLDHERGSKRVPAQRVINSKGELTGSWAFGQPGKMRQLLEAEGIVFSADERVDLKRSSWVPSRDLSERLLHLLRNNPASPLRSAPPTEMIAQL